MFRNEYYSNDSQPERHITWSDGQAFLISEKDLILLTSPVILGNGIIITPDGLVKFPDGSKKLLQEGEFI